MKKLLFIAPFILMLNCQKEVVTGMDTDTPVFYVDYEIDGVNHKIEAGVDNKYMFSGVGVDSLGVQKYYGSLSNINQQPTNALSFEFRNALPELTNVDSTLSSGVKNLVSSNCGLPVSTQFKVKFLPVNTTDLTTQKWVIKGNIVTHQANPVYTFDTNEVTSIPVNLSTYYNNSCMASASRCLDFRSLDCYADFTISHTYGSTYYFEVPSHMLPEVEKVVWYIGSDVIEGPQVSYTFKAGAGGHFIHANVYFKNGCKSCLSKKMEVDLNGLLLSCSNDIQFEIEEFINYEHLQLNKLLVNYWDKNGVLYSSLWSANPGNADIISIENYKRNKDGLPTKKIHLKGDFILTSLSGNKKTLNNVDALIAVAYTE